MSLDDSDILTTNNSRGFFLLRLPFVFAMIAISLCGSLVTYGLDLSPFEQESIKSLSLIGVGLWALRTLSNNWKNRKIERWPHFIIAIFLLSETISFQVFGKGIFELCLGTKLGLIDNLFLLSVNFAVAVSLGFEILENSKLGRLMIKHHAQTFLYLMIILILSGTAALLMPKMVSGAVSLRLSDAFFCASGVSTLTSLSTITNAQLSAQGEVVRLVLMQCAGMLTLGYAAFLFMQFRQRNWHNDFADKTLINSSAKTIKQIFAWLLVIELAGALILFGVWDQGIKFSGNDDKLFDSLYHAVSAISNCGLSTFENGLKTTSPLRHNYLAHWILMLLTFIGSIGFIVVLDLFSRKSIKARLAQPKLRLTKASQWILYGSCSLICVGAIIFFLTERNAAGLAEHQNIFGGITTSLFQSVMTGSGFATATWSKSWWFILGFLFIIGGSVLGTGGGIRIENIARAISPAAKLGLGSLKKMTGLFVIWNISAIGLLYFSETHILNDPKWGMDTIIFEQLSAFCNAGHSAGVTSQLSLTGQLIIIMSMFVGRVSFLFIIGRSLIKSLKINLECNESSLNNNTHERTGKTV